MPGHPKSVDQYSARLPTQMRKLEEERERKGAEEDRGGGGKGEHITPCQRVQVWFEPGSQILFFRDEMTVYSPGLATSEIPGN